MANTYSNKKKIEFLSVEGKKVLVRVDFNVPLKDGKVTDDTRIQESLPTIRCLLKKNAAVILCAHLGRPKGTVNLKYSLQPVAKKLGEILGMPVNFAEDCVGDKAKKAATQLKQGQVLLLENLRFHPEEEKNDESFAKELASLASCFVQDAFGAVHRAHASTVAVTKFLPSAAGFLLQKELNALGKVIEGAQHPFVAVLGGAKVSDKIGVIQHLLEKTDSVFVGGAMAYTFLKAQGKNVGNSLVEEDKLDLAKKTFNSKVHLPLDHRIAEKPEAGMKVQTTPDQNIPDGMIGIDVGPQTSKQIEKLLEGAKTIFWNGPLGIFEIPEFATGTLECAKTIANATKKGSFSIVGGGDSVAALKQSGLSGSISHISTGGGASLEFIEGKPLPGVEALPNG